MTLVLVAVASGLAVQVADRLVSLQRGVRLEALDRSATKLLIYVARDAHVSIGYAGQAFIRGKPVDEVIAEVLTGETFDRGPGEMCGVQIGARLPRYDIGLAIDRITKTLVAGILASQVIQLLVVGHQFNRRGLVRPLAMRIELNSSGLVRARRLPRNFPRGVGLVESIGIQLGHGGLRRIVDEVFNDPEVTTLDQVAQKLTEAIRRNGGPGVGPNTTAVLLPVPRREPIETGFFPVQQHTAILRTPSGEEQFVADLSPWIIVPGLIKPPTAEIGSTEFGAGGLRIVTRSAPAQPEIPGGPMFAMTTTPRFELPAGVRS